MYPIVSKVGTENNIVRYLFCTSHELTNYGLNTPTDFISFEDVVFGDHQVKDENYKILMNAVNGVKLEYK